VYQILHPLRAPVNRPVRVHDHLFVAKYVDYLWHTDLHELHVPDETTGGTRICYLTAFLDDASRFMVHHRLIPEKRVDPCAAVLAETFQMWVPPCVLGTDNGGKFTGEAFTSVLCQHGVTPWRTRPYTPEQIERWSVSGGRSNVLGLGKAL
jgi:transposase InsO family protein